MTAVGAGTIRGLFSLQKPIDRPIEKVIDYQADDAERLKREIDEYVVTDSIERNLQKFLDHFGDGVRTGHVTETGIWISGFYGSGKSSFTKYLGFALDPNRMVGDRRFLDLFRERIDSQMIRAELGTLAEHEPTAIVMLDLGSEQLASSATAPVSQVLYSKVLQWAGYSKEEKLAELEFRLEQDGLFDRFRQNYEAKFGGKWEDVHNDALSGVSRADQIVTEFYPQDYPEPGDFRKLRFSLQIDAREQATRMLDLVKHYTGHNNVIFLIDEVGQYVAPSGDRILNLDGLARNIKELGNGRAWIVATGQQTLKEIVERQAFNSTELNQLMDRFSISIELDARDITEITHRRLLEKSSDGQKTLRKLFQDHGQALTSHTRLSSTNLFRSELSEEKYINFYPFLPYHFDVMMELVRNLARARGGIGLRSAIRVIQDLLVDASNALPPGSTLLVDEPIGTLATADAFYDTLRADILKVLPHAVEAVDRIEKAFPEDQMVIRAGKAIAALQLIEQFPRTPENVAALLYRKIGTVSLLPEVQSAVDRLLAAREIGLFNDPQSGGLSFLSEKMTTLRGQRDAFQPSSTQLTTLRSTVLKDLFDPLPRVSLQQQKTVQAGIRIGKGSIAGDDNEIQFQLEIASSSAWDERRSALLTETIGNNEWKSAIAWLFQQPSELEETLVELAKSEEILKKYSEHDADKDNAQFARAERNTSESHRARAKRLLSEALKDGLLIYKGRATTANGSEATVDGLANERLKEVAADIYSKFSLAAIRPNTDLAAKFLSVERIDRMPTDADPLGFVTKSGGKAAINTNHRTLGEAKDEFMRLLESRDASRLQGSAIQDHFDLAPYGWSKDATRYVFAALLAASEIVLHTPAGEIKTPGQTAVDAMRNTQTFGKVGVSTRNSRPSGEELLRAADGLQSIVGVEVLFTESDIADKTLKLLPAHIEPLAALSYRLQNLGLDGAERAARVYQTGKEITTGDGSGAISVLGAVDSSFVNDLRWAEQIQKILDNGGEQDVKSARETLREIVSLEAMPTDLKIIDTRDLDTIEDVLKSSDFASRRSDLRTATSNIHRAAVAAYEERAKWLNRKLQADLEEIEKRPGWLELSDDDRERIAHDFTFTLPATTNESKVIAALKTLLMRELYEPQLLPRAFKAIEDARPNYDPETRPTRVRLSQIAHPSTIRSEEQIDSWTEQLRAGLLQHLQDAGGPIEVEFN